MAICASGVALADGAEGGEAMIGSRPSGGADHEFSDSSRGHTDGAPGCEAFADET